MKEFQKILREIIPVIIGILIALIINNWNEDRKEKKYLQKIFTAIDKEMEESRNAIIKSIPKQKMLIDSTRFYLNDETVSLFEIITKANGIQSNVIKNSSWKAIANSKIELIEFEKISLLTEIDESKKSHELKIEKLVDFMVKNLKTTSPEKKEIFLLFNQDILSTVEYSKSEIDQYLGG